MTLDQGKQTLWVQNLTLAQPLTQLVKIHHGYEAASAEERAAEDELRKMETDIAFKTRQVYFGLLIARARRDAAAAAVAAAGAGDQDARDAVRAGNALNVLQIGSRAQLLAEPAETARRAGRGAGPGSRTERPDGAAHRHAPGPGPRARWKPGPCRPGTPSWTRPCRSNPELARAQATVQRSRSALAAGKAEYIPDVNVFVRQTHQEGLPFVQSNLTTVGVSMSWSIFDGGRKASVVSQRNALVAQASDDRDRLRRRVEVDLGKDPAQAGNLQAPGGRRRRSPRPEDARRTRLAANQLKAGVISAAKQAEAEAAAQAAEADLLAARLGLHLAYAELDQLPSAGHRPDLHPPGLQEASCDRIPAARAAVPG